MTDLRARVREELLRHTEPWHGADPDRGAMLGGCATPGCGWAMQVDMPSEERYETALAKVTLGLTEHHVDMIVAAIEPEEQPVEDENEEPFEPDLFDRAASLLEGLAERVARFLDELPRGNR